MGGTQAGRPAPTAGACGHGEFDFLLGEWDLAWDDGRTGTSSVYSDLGGAVIVESFDGRPSIDLQGLSMTVHDAEADVWRQTRVDSDGRFVVLAGRFADGVMELVSEPEPQLRVRFKDIAQDGLTWVLDRSDDGGATWERSWEIAYRRVL